ncbi:MAG TPA: DUF444 family protein [Candidatus Kapabacteria bacterium]|nr:DUF444 family protein [Candidatus Kapabacteria bacterium]
MNDNRSIEEKLNKELYKLIQNEQLHSDDEHQFLEAINFKFTDDYSLRLQTIEDLLDRDEQREKDGFPRRIKLGKIVKQNKESNQVVIVPTTHEPKFYHDDSYTEEDKMGGAGEGEEGEVIGETPLDPQEGEGEGQGAGQGGGGENHEVISNAFDLGKVLTEKFNLPNLKPKGKKKSFSKYIYDLTDRNRRFGQILDKKETLRRIVKTNIILGNIEPGEEVDTAKLLMNPNDAVYRIMSPEKDFETTAVVFFLRDYSGSMQGKPTECITSQHLFIYSWLMYQYNQNVQTRFILHDQSAKEVPDFYTYHNSNVAGGTNVYPAFELVNTIVNEEQLARDNNIYVFYGTDGDDWDSDGRKTLNEIDQIFTYVSRMGITIAKNSWGGSGLTTVEKYIQNSGILTSRPDLIRLDSFPAAETDENRLIEGIRKLVEEKVR